MTEIDISAHSLGEKSPSGITKRDKAKFLTHELKASVRGLLHNDVEQQSMQKIDLFEDVAFDPQRALQPEDQNESSLKRRLSVGVRTIVNTIKNPKAVGRNNYTRHAVAKVANHPHDQSDKFDKELLNAHDALSREQELYDASFQGDSESFPDSQQAAVLEEARSRVDRIEEQRENLKSGWILGRHVVRARAVRPMALKPERAQFLDESIAHGQSQQLRSGRYLGHLALWYTQSFTAHRIDDYDEPPFDLRELALTIERLAAVSTPWQTFAHKLRDTYHWEHPSSTIRIMMVYWMLWYMQHLVTSAVALIILITIRNNLYPGTVDSVRDRLRRSQDQSEKARAWGELVQKHGESDWVEPLIDGVGPHLQMQLGDLTMFLERIQNFYRWQQPRQTWWTLGFMVAGLFLLLLTSTQFCVQTLWFVAGCWFFYSFPIATRYPRYRHVVSPWCWMFWAVPDAAEMAIDRLQQKAAERDKTRMDTLLQQERDDVHHYTQDTTTIIDQVTRKSALGTKSVSANGALDKVSNILRQVQLSDEVRFAATLLPLHMRGQVFITRTHIRFESDKGESFSRLYTDVLEMRKINLDKDTDQSSTSNGTNKLSRTSHIAASLQRSGNVQLLPDGLGFTFLRRSSSDVASGTPGFVTPRNTNQVYANTTDTRPALDPRTQPQVDPARSMYEENARNTAVSRQDTEQDHGVSVTFVLNKTDRDRIFTVVLAWSNMKWQPLYSMNRQNKLGVRKSKTGKKETADGSENLNGNLDDAIKRGLM